MDRRGFLQCLLASGLIPHLPAVAATCSEETVKEAWTELQSEPAIFEVTGSGTILIPNYSEPTTRAECLGLDERAPEDAERLIRFIREDRRMEDVVNYVFEDSGATHPSGIDYDWEDWIREDPEHAADCAAAIDRWLEETDLGELDIEMAGLRGYNSQGAALSFWRDCPKELENFPVDIVYGDQPGSSYYAAVLCCSVIEANELAVNLDLPIRFVEV